MSGSATPFAGKVLRELTAAEWQAVMAFVDGATIARPIRRRLIQAQALVETAQGLKLSKAMEKSLVELAPRCKWSPPGGWDRVNLDETKERMRPRTAMATVAAMALLASSMPRLK